MEFVERAEHIAEPIKLLALNLQFAVLQRAAGTAGVFELSQQQRQVIVGSGQSANDGHDFAPLAFLNGECRGLLIGRLANGRQWRASAFGFELVTALAMRRSIERRPGKQSHERRLQLILGAMATEGRQMVAEPVLVGSSDEG